MTDQILAATPSGIVVNPSRYGWCVRCGVLYEPSPTLTVGPDGVPLLMPSCECAGDPPVDTGSADYSRFLERVQENYHHPRYPADVRPASFGEALEQSPPSLTPPPVHACGRGCSSCSAHNPRDRRTHGHLPADMCDACRAEEVPPGYPDDDILAAAGLEAMARGRDRVSWEDVARAALEEIAKRDALEARKRAHEAATIVHAPRAAVESRPAMTCAHGRPDYVRCSECSPT